ncbi:MAG: PDZ domain-containing protein [Proteobacteria bacterium]|nr:PDZ domain-containing protein [Pseudomonadota bacterium]
MSIPKISNILISTSQIIVICLSAALSVMAKPHDQNHSKSETGVEKNERHRVSLATSQNLVPASTINILIMGTIVSTTQEKKVALIKEQKSKKVMAVKIGDKILDQSPIVDIAKNTITINQDRKIVTLFKGQFAPTRAKTVATKQPMNTRGTRYQEEGLDRLTSEDKIDVKITGAYRDNMIKNQLQKILMEAAAVPKVQNNQIIGFILTNITPGSIFEKAGFTDGDLVQAINDTPLTSPTTAIKILHSLKQETSVVVTIIRGGESMNMSISVN